MPPGFARFARREQQAQVVMRGREPRIEPHGPQVAGLSLARPTKSPIDFPQIVVIDRLTSFDRDGLGDPSQGLLVPTCLMRDKPQQVQGIGMPRIESYDLAIQVFGLSQLPALVQLHRRLERLGDRAHGNPLWSLDR